MVAQNYRYSPVMQRMISLFREKRLGDFGHGHIDFYIPADFTGSFRETMEFPLLVDMAIHHIDLIRAVTGRNVANVIARTFKPSWSWYQHHPGLKMILELDGGVPFSYSGDWSAHGKATSWNGTWRLQFAEGCIVCEDNQISIHRNERWNKNPTSEKVEIPEITLSGQAALLARFAEAIRTGVPAETSGQDNLNSFGAVMSAVESARSGVAAQP
jgi:predicted dehydrogenase